MNTAAIFEKLLAPFVTNPENRAVNDDGICTYYDSLAGKSCPIGAALKNPAMLENVQEPIIRLNIALLNKNFKPEYRGLPKEFWVDVQLIHDNHLYWNENGLTQIGIKRYNSLLAKWRKV